MMLSGSSMAVFVLDRLWSKDRSKCTAIQIQDDEVGDREN